MSTTEILCAHCGQPVPKDLLGTAAEASNRFCCNGCATVYALLHDCNLEEYYRLRDTLSDDAPHPAKVTGKNFTGFDDPAFLAQTAKKLPGGLLEVELFVEGTHCIACAWLIEKILVERASAQSARLDLGRSVVRIVFDPSKDLLSALARQLDQIGYPPHPLTDSAQTEFRNTERTLLTRIGVAAAGAGNIMLLAFALYAGDYDGIEPGYAALFRWVSFGLALPVVLYSGYPFYAGAIRSIRHRVAAIDLPIALGITISFIGSVYATILNRTEVYYDSITSLIFLLLVGRFVLARANRWANEASVSLLDNTPKFVRIVRDDSEFETPIQEVNRGDLLRILPGEIIPVDGELLHETATISEAALTGESTPQWKHPGEILFAGNKVIERPVLLKAEAIGAATRLGRLTEMMREARIDRAPLTLITDRISGWFVFGVLFLAVLTALIWWHIDSSKAIWYATAMMVVTCPCALGIAIPATFATAVGFAAKNGVFIRGASVLEKIASIRHVVLDKTGTLTFGEAKLVDFERVGRENKTEKEILTLVSALERNSNHHFAKALIQENDEGMQVSGVKQVAGAGVSGLVWASPQTPVRVAVGTWEFVADCLGVENEIALKSLQEKGENLGQTPIWVALEGELVVLLWLSDKVRPEAGKAVSELKSMGLSVEILSGDANGAVANAAKELQIESYQSRVNPEIKLQHINELIQQKHISTMMVGDGVNDAAALAVADIGVSPAGSAEVAREAANVFLIETGIAPIVSLFKLAKRTMTRIRINFAIALVYNCVGATLALTGHISPLVAAVLMPLSSLTSLYIATRRNFLTWT